MMKLGLTLDIKRKVTPKVSRAELNFIARNKGIKNYYKISKYDLAEKSSIELRRPRRKQPNGKICRKPHPVEIWNPNGTITTTYPSINQAAQALRKPLMLLCELPKRGVRKIN